MRIAPILEGAGRGAIVARVLVLVLGLSAAATSAGAGREGPPGLREAYAQRLVDGNEERLGLDASTRARIDEISRAARERRLLRAERLRELHRELEQLLDRELVDETAVMRQAERVGEARVELEKLRLLTLLRIRALLTPEQRRKLLEIHRERRSGLRERLRERRRGSEPISGVLVD